jgi:hypothetical protein
VSISSAAVHAALSPLFASPDHAGCLILNGVQIKNDSVVEEGVMGSRVVGDCHFSAGEAWQRLASAEGGGWMAALAQRVPPSADFRIIHFEPHHPIAVRDGSGRVTPRAQRHQENLGQRHTFQDQLRVVADALRRPTDGGPPRCGIFFVSLGGFDTHAGQRERQAYSLREFADAVAWLHMEMSRLGHGHRLMTIAYSEMGRSVFENGCGGTDHGAHGCMFVVGKHIPPGVCGGLPTTDFPHDPRAIDAQQVWMTILDRWFGIAPRNGSHSQEVAQRRDNRSADITLKDDKLENGSSTQRDLVADLMRLMS